MKDQTKKFGKMFAKAMKQLGRTDGKKLEAEFCNRYRAYSHSEEYQAFSEKYPSVGADKVYFGITFAQIMLGLGYSLDDAIDAWETHIISHKRRILERLIRLFDILGKGYRICGSWLDKDKQARDKDGSILYESYHYNEHELEYKIHTCAYVNLFAQYNIRKFCKTFCNNDLCMCALKKSAKFIRYSDKVDGEFCHDKLINLHDRSGAK